MWIVLWQPRRSWMFTCKFVLRVRELWKLVLKTKAAPPCCSDLVQGLQTKRRKVYGVDILGWQRACPFLLYTCRFNKRVCITDFWKHVWPWSNHCKRKWKAIIKLCWSETECALKDRSILLCDIFRRK